MRPLSAREPPIRHVAAVASDRAPQTTACRSLKHWHCSRDCRSQVRRLVMLEGSCFSMSRMICGDVAESYPPEVLQLFPGLNNLPRYPPLIPAHEDIHPLCHSCKLLHRNGPKILAIRSTGMEPPSVLKTKPGHCALQQARRRACSGGCQRGSSAGRRPGSPWPSPCWCPCQRQSGWSSGSTGSAAWGR